MVPKAMIKNLLASLLACSLFLVSPAMGFAQDADGDGIPDEQEDTNGDGILDNDDTDGDGIPDYRDVCGDGRAATAVAEECDATPAQVSLRWLIQQQEFTCVPIVGARTPEQLEENLGATEIELSRDQHDRITNARFDENGRRWGH